MTHNLVGQTGWTDGTDHTDKNKSIKPKIGLQGRPKNTNNNNGSYLYCTHKCKTNS